MNLTYTDTITPEDFLRLRTTMGWTPIAMEQAANDQGNALDSLTPDQQLALWQAAKHLYIRKKCQCSL